jgi:hypothetical protein
LRDNSSIIFFRKFSTSQGWFKYALAIPFLVSNKSKCSKAIPTFTQVSGKSLLDVINSKCDEESIFLLSALFWLLLFSKNFIIGFVIHLGRFGAHITV